MAESDETTPTSAGKQGEWYLMKEGEQSGPYEMDQLKAMVGRSEINPRLDTVWKNGMEDWVPAGEVDGLFQKNAEAEAVEKSKLPPPTSRSHKPETHRVDRGGEPEEDVEWPGTGRAGFIFFYAIFPVLWFGGLFLGAGFIADFVGEDIIKPVVICMSLLPFIIAIAAMLSRFQNLAMSRVWMLGMLVPILNLWLGYRLVACPPGYAEHKKLGVLGVLLAIIYGLPILATIAFGVFFSLKGEAMLEQWIEQNPELVEEFKTKFEEAKTKAQEAAGTEEPEPEEKQPSIVPY